MYCRSKRARYQLSHPFLCYKLLYQQALFYGIECAFEFEFECAAGGPTTGAGRRAANAATENTDPPVPALVTEVKKTFLSN
jgi:hypothetical protein